MNHMIVYHGTASEFSVFRFTKNDWHPSKIGVWFTSTPGPAAIIAKTAKRMVDDTPRVITAQIQMGNPVVFETYADYLAAFREVGGSAIKLRRKLKKEGFDGVVIKHSDTDQAGDRTDFSVFEPHQAMILESSTVEDVNAEQKVKKATKITSFSM